MIKHSRLFPKIMNYRCKKFNSIVPWPPQFHLQISTQPFLNSYCQSKEHQLKGKAQYSWPPHKRSLFCKKVNIFCIIKAADLNYLVQGGQRYWSFPSSKGSLVKVSAPWLESVFHFCKYSKMYVLINLAPRHSA